MAVESAQVAQCVSKAFYVSIAQWAGAEEGGRRAGGQAALQGMPGGGLAGERVGVLVSNAEGTAPLRLAGLDLKAGVSAGVNPDGTAGRAGEVQESACRGCVDLFSDRLAPETDFVATGAVVGGGAAGAVTAGILWLTVMAVSG